jgi:hypothetical protein
MIAPLQVEFHNTPPIEDVEFLIRRELAELEKFYNHLVSCRIDVELPAHKREGSMAKVRIDFGVPAARAAAETEHLKGDSATQGRLHGGPCRLQHGSPAAEGAGWLKDLHVEELNHALAVALDLDEQHV